MLARRITYLIRLSFLLMALISFPWSAHAHSVGQVQTTKFFAPETVQMLTDRAVAGHSGLQVGDIVTYIIQFTPIENANSSTTGFSKVGVNGYVTDYIPPGTQVVGASIVTKDSSGNYNDIPPSLPGGIDDGWGIMAGVGDTGQQIYLAPFNNNAYDSRCSTRPAGRCNSRLTTHNADTGIFFSTDSRTAQYPALPTRIQQSTNGYVVNPTGKGQLNPFLGQPAAGTATTHNLWDADQTNAFGSSNIAGTGSSAPILMTNGCGSGVLCIGFGAPPFNAGSAVAGSQSGYQLDNTGNVGPWQRIAYTGSRMGDASRGPATTNGNSLTAIDGFYTSVGWNLSPSNPLPSGTNAVRWAVGKLTVGEQRYAKISLRLTAPVPSYGLINGSEVFGGDTAEIDDGAHNTWRYHVPSVADNNSNLFVTKSVIGYGCAATSPFACTAGDGSYIPQNTRLRYRVVYLNSSNVNQTNVVLSDTLPCQTPANPVRNIRIVSGPITLPTPNPPVIAAGGALNAATCAAGTRRTFSFPTLGTLAPGQAGTIEYDVLTDTTSGNTVPNTAQLVSNEMPSGVTSNTSSYVQSSPNIDITKTTSTPTVTAGGAVTYSITFENTGTANATGNIIVRDFLPTSSATLNAATRFSYASTVSVTADASNPVGSVINAPTVATSIPPTLAPYNAGAFAANQQQVAWTFAGSVLVPRAKYTITFTATVGANVPASATPYYNSAAVSYTGGVTRSDVLNTAPVTVTSTLSLTKSITHYYDTVTSSWLPYTNFIPTNGKVRYRIDYANTGGSSVTSAILTDTMPCQTAANPVSNITIISGPITLPATNPPTLAAGVCSATRQSFSFPAATITAGQSGQITLDVQTNASNGNVVVNGVSLAASGASTVTSEVQTTAQSTPVLSISKSSPSTGAKAGDTVSYTLTVSNSGTASASGISVYDWLPTAGAVANAATRYSYVVEPSTFSGSITSVNPTVNMPPTKQPYNNVPAGSNTNSANQQEIVWNFGAQTLAPGASFTITFRATIGTSVSIGTYSNNAAVYYNTSMQSSASPLPMTVSNSVADVSITKTNGTSVVTPGGSTTYTVTINNNGPDAANNTVVVDPVTTGLSKSVADAGCTASGGADCPAILSKAVLEGAGVVIPALPLGGQVVLTVNATVTAANGATVTNTAYINLPSGVTDGNWANNSASDMDQVMALQMLTIVKEAAPATVIPGDVITYKVTVTNTGSGQSTNVVLEDVLNPYVQFGILSYAGVPFKFTEGSPASGLSLGSGTFYNSVGTSFTPSSGGGGAPAGYDATVARWSLPMVGIMNSGGAKFTVEYQVRVK